MRNVLSKYSANHPPNPVHRDQSVTAVSRLAVTCSLLVQSAARLLVHIYQRLRRLEDD